jgi:transposase-like protein
MSKLLSYQSVLNDTITDFVIHQKLTIEQILVQVVESLMQAERHVFLQTQEDNKGNGYYSRFVNSFQGKLCLRVPRDRQGLFYPLLLEIIQQDSVRMQDLALQLYSHGVSHRGVQQIFNAIFQTSLSPAKVSQLVEAFEPHRVAWQQRALASHYHVVVIDALHQSIRRGTVEKEAIYVVMGLTQEFTREILGLYQFPQETASGWESVFMDLTQRGLQQVNLVLCDELSGIEAAVEAHLPHRHLQTCLVHKVRRLLTQVRHQDKAALASDWQAVLGLDQPTHTPDDFAHQLALLIDKWAMKYPGLKRQLPEFKWRYYQAYLHYPFALRRMLYTTNWIERLNKDIRKVTRHVNSFPSPNSALNLVFLVIQQAQERTYAKPLTFFYPYRSQMDSILHTQQTHNY